MELIYTQRLEGTIKNFPATLRFYDGPNGWTSCYIDNGRIVIDCRCECS